MRNLPDRSVDVMAYWKPRVCISFLALFFVIQLFHLASFRLDTINTLALPNKNRGGAIAGGRKLLQSSPPGDSDRNRIGTACSKDDIVIYQGSTTPLPSGIPSYTVQILNVCVSGCSISDIHVSCGWFSSARLVNPMVFRRLDYDDCLVNSGEALAPGETLSFQYANSFQYPLSVSSVACC